MPGIAPLGGAVITAAAAASQAIAGQTSAQTSVLDVAFRYTGPLTQGGSIRDACRAVAGRRRRKAHRARSTRQLLAEQPDRVLIGCGRAQVEAEEAQPAQPVADQKLRARISGRYRLALANDTVWETIDPVAFEARNGADITIRRAPLGGFRAMIDGGRSILIKRVR